MITAKELIKKYKKALTTIGRVLAVVVALVLVIFCNMLESIGDANFDFTAEMKKNLHSPLTWVLAISISLAWIVIYTVVYTTHKERKIAENKDLFSKFNEINKTRPNNLGDFLRTVINPRRKETAYHEKMEHELSKVQGQMEKIPLEKQKEKKYLKLKEKEQEIIRKSTPEYIKEHFLSLSVKYNRVTLEHFTFAITNTRVTDKTNSDESKKLGAKLVTKVIWGVLIGISGVSIFSSMSVIFNFKNTGMWVTLIVIILTIFMQIYTATLDAENIVDSEIIAPTETKIKIIEESLLWEYADMTNKPLKKMVDEFVQKQLPKPVVEQNDSDEVEITLAQLKYLKEHENEINEAISKEEENNKNPK